jgi:hypothetical protein
MKPAKNTLKDRAIHALGFVLYYAICYLNELVLAIQYLFKKPTSHQSFFLNQEIESTNNQQEIISRKK